MARWNKFSLGTKLWVGLAGYVFLGDTYAIVKGGETMSASHFRNMQDPGRALLLMAGWGILLKHLMLNDKAKKLDPFNWVCQGIILCVGGKKEENGIRPVNT